MQYVTVKIEGHFMEGNGASLILEVSTQRVHPRGFAVNTNGLVVRTGFSF